MRRDERPAWEREHLDEDGLPSLPPPDFPADEDGPESEGAPAGVPRRSPPARSLVVGLVAIAALVAAAGGLRAMHARQERLAEEERDRAASTKPAVTAAPSAIAPPTQTATPAVSAVPTATAAEAVSVAPSAPSVESQATAAGAEVSALPPAPGPQRPAQETPLETGPLKAGSSLIAQASRAMTRGDVPLALDLAHQAVAANPANADTWLTLGAAYQAAGNPSGARDAYRRCIAQAHGANVSECRVLAGH